MIFFPYFIFQIVSIVSFDNLKYEILLMIMWDRTKPTYKQITGYVIDKTDGRSYKEDMRLMFKFGGKVSQPFLVHLFMEKTEICAGPGDFVFLEYVFVEK